MNRNTFIMGVIIWIVTLLMLIISMTDFVPDNPLIEFRTILGVAFLTITFMVAFVYRKSKKQQSIILNQKKSRLKDGILMILSKVLTFYI